MRALTTCLILAAILLLAAGCGPPDTPGGYELVWHDEFAGPAGQLPDSTKWRFDVGTDWGNAQLEWDSDRAENVSLDGLGHLAITAREEDFSGQPYTSGRIKTKDLFAQTHGRFAARIKLPIGQGIWPAFWMLGANIDEVGWPACGEIDVMEYRGHELNIVHGTIHGPGHFGDDAISNHLELTGIGFDGDFHEFAIEWDEDGITWFVDGANVYRAASGDLPPHATWVYDRPFFMLLNVAVGGRWPGAPDASTRFPQSMLVDWVRVYRAAP